MNLRSSFLLGLRLLQLRVEQSVENFANNITSLLTSPGGGGGT